MIDPMTSLLSYQILNDLFKEYRSPEFGNSLRTLRELFRDLGDNQDRFISEYAERYYAEKDREKSLHHDRRRVPALYQFLGFLVDQGMVEKNIVFGPWKKGDLEIIEYVLRPIECDAMPVLIKSRSREAFIEKLPGERKTVKQMPSVFRHMWDLWDKAPVD